MANYDHIVLLVLDTQRADRLSCYGYPTEISPHLDALAAESTRFSHAIAPAQWTLPTHASMFTGLYPPQHNMVQLDSVLSASIPTLAERLTQNGYLCTGFSNNPLVGLTQNGLQRGFAIFKSYHQGQLISTQTSQTRSLEQTSHPLWSPLKQQLTRWRRDIKQLLKLSPIGKYLWSTRLSLNNLNKAIARSTRYRLSTLADAARMLERQHGLRQRQPLFVFINLMGVHPPYDPPQWALARFAPILQKHPQASTYLKQINTAMLQNYGWLGPYLNRSLNEDQVALLNAVYNAEVAAQDAQIGQFIQNLKAKGILDKTLLIVVADHGDHLGEKQMLGHASGVYREVLHVPLLIRDPIGIFPPNQEITPYISTRCLFHTILAATKIATPEENALALSQLGSAGSNPARTGGLEKTIFAEARPIQRMIQRFQNKYPDLATIHNYFCVSRAVYDEHYKLITHDQEPVALYALHNDPTETSTCHLTQQAYAYTLQRFLQTWTEEMQPVALSQKIGIPDTIIKQRLRDLGYL